MKRCFKYYSPIYDLDKEYFIENVEYERKHATERIKTLKEEIKKLDKYICYCDERKAYIENDVTYEVEVIIERVHDFNHKVHYDVYVNRFVIASNGIKHTKRIEKTIRFSGRERKAALNYADELGKKYKVEVYKKYFNLK